ncbi:MAG: acylphosphatase [Erysipelotrichia bacterium]|nr:acylphosphatase [Erysipelotrichia bacterium]
MRAVYSGRVQNVGFRGFAAMNALQFNLTGFVRNLEDGDVIVEVQGEKSSVLRFLSTMKAGNQFIRVDYASLEELPNKDSDRRFACEW